MSKTEMPSNKLTTINLHPTTNSSGNFSRLARWHLTHFRPMFHLCKNQLPNLSITGTLVENRLTLHSNLPSTVAHI